MAATAISPATRKDDKVKPLTLTPEQHAGFMRDHFPAHAAIQAAVIQERIRQDELFPGKWELEDDKLMQNRRLVILAEEFGEVARAIIDDDQENLDVELVQVAAVAIAWLEARWIPTDS